MGLRTVGSQTMMAAITQLLPYPIFAGPGADPSWNQEAAQTFLPRRRNRVSSMATVTGGPAGTSSLTLRSITLPDLALLQPLAQLRALDIKLSGTRDLTLLPAVGQLEYVELWVIRGFSDLAPAVDNAIAMSFVEDVGWWDAAMQPFIDVRRAALTGGISRQRDRSR